MKRMILTMAVGVILASCLSMPDVSRMQNQRLLMQQLMKGTDMPAWHTQRKQITQALGDRVFAKDFNRVFDSLTVALASMGMTVDNMERQSGYIAAHGQLLPPEIAKPLRMEELIAWCKSNGYDPSLVERRPGDMIDPDMSSGTIGKFGTTLTIALVSQSEKQTKVKLRFNGIYYPRTLEESYKISWPLLDKQIFLDQGID